MRLTARWNGARELPRRLEYRCNQVHQFAESHTASSSKPDVCVVADMSPPASGELDLNRLRNGTPGITPDFGGCLCEAASVCLEDRSHTSGVSISVDGALAAHTMPLVWPAATQQAKHCYADPQFAVEFGAYGIAVLLIERLTEFTVVERSRKGTGFDYWLGPKRDAQPLFQDKRKLEVSGVLDGDENDVRRRLRQKLDQLRRGGVPLPGYGIVVCFAAPEARVGAP